MANRALCLAVGVWLLAGATARGQELERYEFSHPQMGTLFRIILYAGDELTATEAATAAMARIDTLNAVFSDYRNDSELSRLSETAGSGVFMPVSADLWFVLGQAQRLSACSQGAFDITVGPLSRLWRRAFRQQAFPEAARLDSARRLVGFPMLALDSARQGARLSLPGMRLDAGGIAKGYAVDEAMAVLHRHGIRQALVDGGGDLLAADPPPGAAGWRVQGPGDGESSIVLLRNEALATSGDTYRYLQWAGRRYSHLIDPRTGLGITERRLVTVRAPDCLTADALASALSILGQEAGRRLLDHYPQCSFQITTDAAPDTGN